MWESKWALDVEHILPASWGTEKGREKWWVEFNDVELHASLILKIEVRVGKQFNGHLSKDLWEGSIINEGFQKQNLGLHFQIN